MFASQKLINLHLYRTDTFLSLVPLQLETFSQIVYEIIIQILQRYTQLLHELYGSNQVILCTCYDS